MKSHFLAFLAFLLFTCCDSSKLPEVLAKGSIDLSAKLYKNLNSDEKDFVFSPFALISVLALAREGAVGETANEITSALQLPPAGAPMHSVAKEMFDFFQTENGDTGLRSANRIFLSKYLTLQAEFGKIAKNVFRTENGLVDFMDPVRTVKMVNDWVKEATNNTIEELLKSNDLKYDTRMVLMNALYLSAPWLTPFSVENTSKMKFSRIDGTESDVDMMHGYMDVGIYTDKIQKYSSLELKFKNINASMIIVLPHENQGLKDLEDNALNELLTVPKNFSTRKTLVFIPKWTIDHEIDLTSILPKVGIKKLFSDPDLSRVSTCGMKVDKVKQRTFIKVEEKGTEASAVAGVVRSHMSGPQPIMFIVDHPFLYYIESNGVILCAGRFAYPKI